MEWNDLFMTLFRDATERYHVNPNCDPDYFFLPNETQFLSSIGYRPREMYDYIKDFARTGVPTTSTALLIAATRRSFFLTTQRGISGQAQLIGHSSLPSEMEEYQGISYLPRLIKKAEAKLHGTLDPQIMYCCAKDRHCLQQCGNMPPADFLFLVWEARGDRQKIITAIMHRISKNKADAPEPAPQGESCSL